MLQQAVDRTSSMTSIDRVLVVTDVGYVEEVRHQVPELPSEHVIGEPCGRGTAACIGLAALRIQRSDPDAVMAVLASDHLIESGDRFVNPFRAAEAAVQGTGRLATIGIVPTRPETGYGYIHFGEAVEVVHGETVYRVNRFVEKPPSDQARAFLEDGHYLWNSGMFVWNVATILRMLEVHLPDTYAGLQEIGRAMGTAEEERVLSGVYEQLDSVTIDYGVMEKADNVVALRGAFAWSDIGTWTSLGEAGEHDGDGNTVWGEHVGIDTGGSIVHAPGKLVATIGLEDVVVVVTEDAVLVCRKDRAQDVRKVVEELERRGLGQYL